MALLKVPLVLMLLVLSVSWCKVQNVERTSDASSGENEVKVRDKRAIDPLSLIGLIVSVGATILGAICTFSSICSKDEITPRLEKIEKKLEAIHNDVKSIKKDVEDIWNESKRKWYFNNIEYVANQRKKVIEDIKSKDTTGRAKERQKRFINLVLGGEGQDEFIEKALFHIPDLVVNKGLVTHYFKVQTDNGKSPAEAAKLTWIFIRKLFRYQEDGYVSVVLAASLKYKDDNASFKKVMKEVCKWWPKLKDPTYTKLCDKLGKDEGSRDNRKMQQDFVFSLRDLALVPVQLVQTDCNKFADSYTLLYSTGYLYVAQPQAKKILIVKPDTLAVVKSIDVPGSECGGNCHPYGISIYAPMKLFAIAAKTSTSGGKSKLMLFKIQGDLNDPSGISLEHYTTFIQLFYPWQSRREADLVGVAFCGERLAYADKYGSITNYEMPYDKLVYGYNNGKPDPIQGRTDRVDWGLQRRTNYHKGKQYYFGCSNDGKYFVIERELSSHSDVVAVPSDEKSGAYNVLDLAKIKVMKKDWYDVKDSRSRINIMKGIAMDSKGNLFYSAQKGIYVNGVSGVYQRTYDGKRRYIREWGERKKVEMYGMAVDDSGFLYSVENIGSGKCLYKFDHEIDLEDINIP